MNDNLFFEPAQNETLYIPLGNPKSLKIVPSAFTVPDNISPVIEKGFTIAWTKEARANFAEIQKAIDKKNLPYASLRGYLEVVLENAARIESNVGLSKYVLNKVDEPETFVYLIGGTEAEVKDKLRPIINEWITLYLRPFVEKENISAKIVDHLEDLQTRGELLEISAFESQILPWGWSKDTGTTNPKDKYSFPMLADYAARQIAGKEIFQGLGPMKRIISSSGGNFNSCIAELITKPITIDGKKGKFSLLVRLEVVTYPSLHQPLLKVDVSKRRWISQFKSSIYDRNKISGFMFSQEYPDRAFSYTLQCKQDKHDKQKKWVTDTDFETLRRQLKLPLQSFDGQKIALGKASTDICDVVLTARYGLQDSSDASGIKAGVPEIDKLEAVENIAKILNPSELQVFESYYPVESEYTHKTDDTASRMINLPTLLGGVLEVIDKNSNLELTPTYLEKLEDTQLKSLLKKHFGISLEAIYGGKNSLQSSDQINELKAIIEANKEAMQRLYPDEKLSLIIFYEDNLQLEALELEKKLLQEITRLLWGDTLEIIVNRLPADTHGPRDILPGNTLNAKQRSEKRIEAWQPIAEQIKKRGQRTFCLIVARKFYSDSSSEKSAKPDDKVNKASTRQALSTMAGASVQFLLPINKTKTTNCLKLGDFFHRTQAALKDLLFAHSGRIDDVKEKVDKYLERIPDEARPKEILAITIVRKQKGRSRGRIENTFLPVAMRLNVETGKCELCCAYQDKAGNLEISPWKNFSDALAFISQLSPVTLGKNDVRNTRFMKFVKQTISNSVEENMQPLVMIDSSNCVKLWGWLADTKMNANQINLGHQYKQMQDEWKGARLIRIRQELAPGIIDKKVRLLAETSLEDTRTKKELTPTYEIPSASSSMDLFRLSATDKTGCVAYLSVGRKTLHQYTRGQSCYRSTPGHIAKKADDSQDKINNKAGLEVHQLSPQPPFVKQWPTPNPLEIVVTLRQADDNPDDLALLVESLRYSFGHYGDWTSLPAPLFFERVVRDYISDFAIAALNEDIEDQEIERDS
ncbi:DUF3893 domain-containing protein [Sphaerospermopsis aphanizomenoides BCCUSP55]|uniref:RNaseH domain-containing protein n=1 Tax=Sphaerospermopsis aphanizomenoides TaxID=459663 RepID=UPI00190896BB|nr:RNaseH domain-containing protein [Sphaerospermopsis aphanizomenoides]MBK1990121.1 DUF3893 domain-containing protein [Sphaerospermopsis aphanizomenoides BCCUSP55]